MSEAHALPCMHCQLLPDGSHSYRRCWLTPLTCLLLLGHFVPVLVLHLTGRFRRSHCRHCQPWHCRCRKLSLPSRCRHSQCDTADAGSVECRHTAARNALPMHWHADSVECRHTAARDALPMHWHASSVECRRSRSALVAPRPGRCYQSQLSGIAEAARCRCHRMAVTASPGTAEAASWRSRCVC